MLLALGKRIREVREGLGLSQIEFAKALNLESAVAISKYESDKSEPGLEKLTAICNLGQVSFKWLIIGEGDKIDIAKIASRLTKIQSIENPPLGDLEFIAYQLIEAYKSSLQVTRTPVVKMYGAVLFLASKAKNLKELTPKLKPYLLLSEKYVDLPSIKANFIELLLLNSSKVDASYAQRLAVIFLILARDGSFRLKKDDLKSIADLLHPWCYWVIKRYLSLSLSIPHYNFDEDSLGKIFKAPKSDKELSFQRSHIYATIFLKNKYDNMLLIGGFEFSNQRSISIGCSAITMIDLIAEAANQEKAKSEDVHSRKWNIVTDVFRKFNYIQRDGMRIFLTNEEMNDFISVLGEIGEHADIKLYLAKAFADKYGIL